MPEYDFHEAAARLGVSWHTVRRRAKEGKLPARLDEDRRKWLVALPDIPAAPDVSSLKAQEAVAEDEVTTAEATALGERLVRVETLAVEAIEERTQLRLAIDRLYREAAEERRRLIDLLELASKANMTVLAQISDQLAEARAAREAWVAAVRSRAIEPGEGMSALDPGGPGA